MKVRNIYQPFEVELFDGDVYEPQSHINTFFEMVFVLEGEGRQVINKNKLPYRPDKLFLIFPEDEHTFEIDTASKLFFLRFNGTYLKNQSNEWVRKMEFIFHNHNHLPGCILKTITDKPLIRALAEALIREQRQLHPQQDEVCRQLINTIITIAARNMMLQESVSTGNKAKTSSQKLLNYIHHNIYEPQRLNNSVMAKHFNVSTTYVSEYFKKRTGRSLQEYITAYKLKLIETRLRYTDMQINEIVYELGFNDASHMNRIFKKYKGISPTEYRKRCE